jgi:hypothetical protein
VIAGYRTRMSSSVLSGRATFDKVVRMSVHYMGWRRRGSSLAMHQWTNEEWTR